MKRKPCRVGVTLSREIREKQMTLTERTRTRRKAFLMKKPLGTITAVETSRILENRATELVQLRELREGAESCKDKVVHWSAIPDPFLLDSILPGFPVISRSYFPSFLNSCYRKLVHLPV